MSSLLQGDPPRGIAARVWTSRLDWLLPAALSVSLICACVIASLKKTLWADEVFSVTLIRSGSFGKLLHNLAAPADSAQPLYYSLTWAWAHLLGDGATSLRLFSAISICAAVWLLWFALRRGYTRMPAALGILLSLSTSELLLYHVSEIRFYGLLTALVALGLFAYSRLVLVRNPSAADLVLQAIATSALVFCHITGWFYSGALLAAYVVGDWKRGWFRPKIYAAVGVGWLSFLAWVPSFLHQAGLANPHSNLRPPSLTDLITIYQFDAKLFPFALFAVATLAAVLPRSSKADTQAHRSTIEPRRGIDWSSPQDSVFLGGLAILAVPIAVFLASRMVVPMLLPRYVLPSVLGASVVIASLIARTDLEREPSSTRARAAWGFFLALLVLYPVIRAVRLPPAPVPGEAAIRRYVPSGVPVVVDEGYYFNPIDFYQALPGNQVYYLLDWESAIDPASNWDAAPVDRLMSEWSSLGLTRHVLTLPEFACKSDNWVLLHTPGFVMYERRIARDSAFATRLLGYNETHPLIEVRRKPGRIPAVCREPSKSEWMPPTGPGSARFPGSASRGRE